MIANVISFVAHVVVEDTAFTNVVLIVSAAVKHALQINGSNPLFSQGFWTMALKDPKSELPDLALS